MKKSTLLILFFSLFSVFSSNAQTLEESLDYIKAKLEAMNYKSSFIVKSYKAGEIEVKLDFCGGSKLEETYKFCISDIDRIIITKSSLILNFKEGISFKQIGCDNGLIYQMYPKKDLILTNYEISNEQEYIKRLKNAFEHAIKSLDEEDPFK